MEKQSMENRKPLTPLRLIREQRGWSRQGVTDKLNSLIGEHDRKLPITLAEIGRWERGEHLPHPYWREKLCQVYNRSAIELGLVESEVSGELATTASHGLILDDLGVDSPFWENVHYLR